MKEADAPRSATAPIWLRIASATLAAIVAFGLVLALVLVAGALAGLKDVTGGAAIALLAFMMVGGVVAAFSAARLQFRLARSWPTWTHLCCIVVFVLLCWLLAPQPFTYFEN